MHARRLNFLLFSVACLMIQSADRTHAADQTVPASLSLEQLKAIIADAKPHGTLPPQLEIFPRYVERNAMLGVQRSGEDIKSVTLDSFTARGRYYILRTTDNEPNIEPGKAEQFDVIAFDQGAGEYRRWRVTPDDRVCTMSGRATTDVLKSSLANSIDGHVTKIEWTGEIAFEHTRFNARALEKLTSSTRQTPPAWEWTYEIHDRGTVKHRERCLVGIEPDRSRTIVKVDRPSKEDLQAVAEQLSALRRKQNIRIPIAAPQEHRFEKLNFRMREPGPNFIKLDAKVFESDAALVLAEGGNGTPQSVSVIAEEVGPNFPVTLPQVINVIQACGSECPTCSSVRIFRRSPTGFVT